MGEEPLGMSGGPNLLNYWLWPSAGDRRKQAALLKYLNDHYSVIGVVGMRSGVMDQLAFSGIKILSIDISPHRYDESTALPDLSTSALLEQRTGDLFYSQRRKWVAEQLEVEDQERALRIYLAYHERYSRKIVI